MKISVVGTGYVGLVTATGLASKGHNVVCIDIDQDKVDMVNRAEPPFYEDNLAEALDSCVKQSAKLRASSDYKELLESDATFICVNTSPNSGENADLSYIGKSAKRIGKTLGEKAGYHVVITKSSVVPGTTEELIIPLLEQYSGKSVGTDFGVAVNPEFLQEGKALQCFLNTDRIIVGEYDKRSGDTIEEIYKAWTSPMLRTELKTAEMIKFASNAFLATKITFINEIGNLCKRLGIDIYEVADGMGLDPRIGRSFLNAGIGFGGSCLPKDLEALLHKYEKTGEESALLSAVYQVNMNQPLRIVEAVIGRLGELKNKQIAVLGLAFKPDTDDTRHAPAVRVIQELLGQGARVKAYDPKAMSNMQGNGFQALEYCASARDAVKGCDCVLILTEWDEFKDERIYSDKVVIDGRRVLDPERAKGVCQHYEGVCW
ncbi:UDP-glucose dehydrogenase family protein [Chloroflexota bacterium]